MANGKKSFLLYCDIMHTVQKLTDEQAGKLFKHVLAYVNDVNPVCNDFIIEIAFEPIKQSLKRDLRKYEEIKKKRSEAGKASAESRSKKSTKRTSVNKCEQDPTNSTVIDSVIDSVIDINYKDIFYRWLNYKKERKEKYKTKDSIIACYNNLLKLSNNNKDIAAKIVEQSIANNWAGIFELKNNGTHKTINNGKPEGLSEPKIGIY